MKLYKPNVPLFSQYLTRVFWPLTVFTRVIFVRQRHVQSYPLQTRLQEKTKTNDVLQDVKFARVRPTSRSHLHFLLLAELLHSVHEVLELQFGEQPVGPVLHLPHQQLQVFSLDE